MARFTQSFTAVLAGGALSLASVVSFGATGNSSDAAPPLPTGRIAIGDLDYEGAFRLSSAQFGDSNTNYAVGTIGFNPANRSLFIAGHAQHNAIAEFAIPPQLGTGVSVADLPIVDEPLQPFVALLDDAPTGNPDGLDRITGLYVTDDRLIVNAEQWYDADGGANDTTLVVDADEIDGDVSGYFELNGRVHAGGYMSPIPNEWQSALGGPALTGWASNSSILSRYSVGPALFSFDPADVLGGDATDSPGIATHVHMDFPYQGRRWITPDAVETTPGSASPLWNLLATGRYGFIVPGTATFMVVGAIGGIDSGIGYKITQSDGRLCGGYCAYDADDYANAYWLFDINDMLAADDVHLPRPYSYGTWSLPFDAGGQHPIIGGAFDPATATLYLALANAGKVARYDQPPLILAYHVPSLGTTTMSGLWNPARATQQAERLR